MAKQQRTNGQNQEWHRTMLDWELDIRPLEDCAKSVHSKVLLPAAQAFAANFQNIDSLLMMPFTIAADGVKTFYWTAKYVRTYVDEIIPLLRGKTLAPGMENETKDVRARVSEANRLFQQFLAEEGSLEQIASHIDHSLQQLMRDKKFQESIQVLLLSSTVLIWTAFECLAKDAWVACVNVGGRKLGQRALDSLGTKTIQVGLLARYDFDLRAHLGTILVSKYKFSDVLGIRKAYAAIFDKKETINKIFGKEDLTLLEKYRHLILHRSGIVDEKFKKETSCPQEVGEPLFLNGAIVSRFGSCTTEAGILLIQFVDEWLARDSSVA